MPSGAPLADRTSFLLIDAIPLILCAPLPFRGQRAVIEVVAQRPLEHNQASLSTTPDI